MIGYIAETHTLISAFRTQELDPFDHDRGLPAPHLAEPADVASFVNRGISVVRRKEMSMGPILWIIAAVLVVWGVMTLLRGSVLAGIALIVIGLLVGPGGYSLFA